MSRLRLDDDFFSPIRLDASTVDTSDNSEGSLSDILNADMTLSFTDTVKNKNAMEDNVIKSRRKSELKSEDQNIVAKNPESVNICAPILNKNSSNSLNTKELSSDFIKLNLEKRKDLKHALRKENFVCHQLKQESLPRENVFDCQAPISGSSEQINLKTRSRSSSLSSKDEFAKCNTQKDVKKKQKNITQSSNNICNLDEMHKSSTKLSSEKKLIDSLLCLKKTFNDLKFEDSSVKSTELKEKTSACDSVNKKPNDAFQQVGNLELASDSFHTQYEASIEKIINDCISCESAKIRQNIYMQQMAFYRQINKIKDEMEQQHIATTERLVKVIEELMQMNATLKSTFVDRN